MTQARLHVVTGAFGYTGRYIARRLLEAGHRVKTLTCRTCDAAAPSQPIAIAPLNFDEPDALVEALRGADTLFNTYWIRFARGRVTFDRAVSNSGALVDAAVRAGVRRIVHVSITNPSLDSPLPYFRGKARVERMVMDSGLSHAILRPTVVFGLEDILINNIAWLLRRLPFFVIPGSGEYRLQPVYADDLAGLAVDLAARDENVTLDAVGPEVFTFEKLVRLIAASIGASTRIVHAPPWAALSASRLIGWIVRDVILTADEIAGLSANLLVSAQAPTTSTAFTRWVEANGPNLGRLYASELTRHYRNRRGAPR